LQLLHLLLPACNVHVGALPLVIDLLQPRAMLAEGCLDLQLLLNGSVRQLQADNNISETGRGIAESHEAHIAMHILLVLPDMQAG
jgi:hypothetical protein